ncbi:MAG: helix-turn-helix domain-containing protein [Candidatus Thiodiazotropha sp. (ex Codakia rugifera)]|nr:helix-turn-helix domain-containing protein [Candidatus Thiodiazotropha sp. (ex Codakia rugifera)]
MNKSTDISDIPLAQSSNPQSLLDTASGAIFRISAFPHTGEFTNYSIASHQLAKLNIYLSESDPFTVRRRLEDIEDDSAFDFLILTQLEGTSEIEQEDEKFTVEPGSIAVLVGGLPYTIIFPEKSKRLLLRIPHRTFHERVLGRKVCEFGAHIYNDNGLVRIVIALLKSLEEECDKLSDTEQYTVADKLLELIGTVLRSESGLDKTRQGSAQAARMCRILSYLEENYSDHELTPAKVASANAVSMRHLHNLFKQSGMTVCKWIWERRLQSAREDILDASMLGKSISEIAYDKGFNDSAHFSRAFKERFNVTPSKLRKMVVEQD